MSEAKDEGRFGWKSFCWSLCAAMAESSCGRVDGPVALAGWVCQPLVFPLVCSFPDLLHLAFHILPNNSLRTQHLPINLPLTPSQCFSCLQPRFLFNMKKLLLTHSMETRLWLEQANFKQSSFAKWLKHLFWITWKNNYLTSKVVI